MADTVFSEVFDDKPIIEGLDRIESKIKEIAAASDKMGDTMAASINEVDESVAALTKDLTKNADAVSEQAKAVDAASKTNASWLSSIKQTVAGLQIGGKSLAEWKTQLQGVVSGLSKSISATDGASKASTRFFGVLRGLAIGPIGLVLTAVAGLIGYFTKFQSGIDKVNQVLAATNAVMTVLIDRATSVASAIGNFFSGDFEGAAKDLNTAFSGIGSAIADSATRAIELEKRMQSLRDQILATSVDVSRQRIELERLKQIRDDDTLSISRRADATRKAGAIEAEIAGKRVELAATALDNAREALDLEKDNQARKEEFADAQIKLDEAIIEQNTVKFEQEAKLRELNKQAAEERKKQSEARKKALEDEAKLLAEIRKELERLGFEALSEGLDKELEAVNRRYDQLISDTGAAVAKLRDIEKRRRLSPEELQQIEAFNQIAVDLEARRLDELTNVLVRFNEKEAEQDKEAAEKRAENLRNVVKSQFDLRAQQIEIAQAEGGRFIAVLEQQGADEEKVERARAELQLRGQEGRLENQIRYNKELLELVDAGDDEQAQKIAGTIALLEKELETVRVKLQGKEEGKKPFNLADFLGLNPEQVKALQDAAGQILDSLNEIQEARIDAAKAAVDAENERIKALEDALKKEEALKEQGFANDTDLVKRQLEEAKKARQKALEEEAQARRAQILLDSAQQASSLYTAGANIFKSFSALPFGAGIPIASVIVAAMVAAFIKSKAEALKAVAPPKLRKGKRIEGRTHEQNGELYELEHGEWVIGTEHSKEHDPFLARMNRGEFKGVDLSAIVDRSRGEEYAMPGAVSSAMSVKKEREQSDNTKHYRAMVEAYREGAEAVVEAIVSRPTVYPVGQPYKVETTKRGVKTTKVVTPK